MKISPFLTLAFMEMKMNKKNNTLKPKYNSIIIS